MTYKITVRLLFAVLTSFVAPLADAQDSKPANAFTWAATLKGCGPWCSIAGGELTAKAYVCPNQVKSFKKDEQCDSGFFCGEYDKSIHVRFSLYDGRKFHLIYRLAPPEAIVRPTFDIYQERGPSLPISETCFFQAPPAKHGVYKGWSP